MQLVICPYNYRFSPGYVAECLLRSAVNPMMAQFDQQHRAAVSSYWLKSKLFESTSEPSEVFFFFPHLLWWSFYTDWVGTRFLLLWEENSMQHTGLSWERKTNEDFENVFSRKHLQCGEEAMPFMPYCDSGSCFYINIQRNKQIEEWGAVSQHPSIHHSRKQEKEPGV